MAFYKPLFSAGHQKFTASTFSPPLKSLFREHQMADEAKETPVEGGEAPAPMDGT